MAQAFAKFVKTEVKHKDLLLAASIIVLLGILSGLLTNCIWNGGDSDVNSSEAKVNVVNTEHKGSTASAELTRTKSIAPATTNVQLRRIMEVG